MKVLALETSERIGSLAALVEDGECRDCVAEVTLPRGERAARTLVPAIESLLADLSWQTSELDLIAVTSGPGSFTGCRIGVTTAKTLSYATGAKLVSVHTLSAIAAGVAVEFSRLWTILDAQRGELFVSSFDAQEICPSPETKIVDAEHWVEGLSAGDIGRGSAAYETQRPIANGRARRRRARLETAGGVRRSTSKSKPTTQDNTVDPMQLVPNYFRKSAAEEKADLQS